MRAVAVPRKSPGEPSDAYLGLLYPTEDFKVFGCAARPTPAYSAAGPQYGPDWLVSLAAVQYPKHSQLWLVRLAAV